MADAPVLRRGDWWSGDVVCFDPRPVRGGVNADGLSGTRWSAGWDAGWEWRDVRAGFGLAGTFPATDSACPPNVGRAPVHRPPLGHTSYGGTVSSTSSPAADSGGGTNPSAEGPERVAGWFQDYPCRLDRRSSRPSNTAGCPGSSVRSVLFIARFATVFAATGALRHPPAADFRSGRSCSRPCSRNVSTVSTVFAATGALRHPSVQRPALASCTPHGMGKPRLLFPGDRRVYDGTITDV